MLREPIKLLSLTHYKYFLDRNKKRSSNRNQIKSRLNIKVDFEVDFSHFAIILVDFDEGIEMEGELKDELDRVQKSKVSLY